MLNNTEIIENLTEEQKIALVADVFAAAGEAFGAAGVPHIEKTDLDTLNLELGDLCGPEFSALAASFNTKLIEFVADVVLSRADTNRFNLVGMPRASVKTGPCSSGISEDPYFTAKFADACAAAIERAGARSVISGGCPANSEIEYLDAHADDGVVFDLLTRAVDTVLRARKSAVAELSLRMLKGEWKAVNTRVAEKLRAAAGGSCIVKDASEEVFLGRLAEPDMLFSGASVSALRSALKNYERMKEDVEHGSIGAEELEKAVKIGTAVSAETLDAAVDKIIDRIIDLTPRGGTAPKTDDECKNAALFAARESIVMLKNSGVLPVVKPNMRIAAVGELFKELPSAESAFSSAIGAFGASYAGYADGYKLDEARSDELIAPAAALMQSADIAVAFIGLGRKADVKFSRHESLELPANQYAALDALRKTGKPVIAVIVGGTLPNMKFDNLADGILVVPFGGGQTVKALCEIIFGKVCPSGRLVATAYNDADEYYSGLRQAVAAGRYKIGGFIGYRRYATENTKVKYPFGFGLSYGKFAYSALKVAAGNVEFTLKNTGDVAAAEVVQLYVGKKNSQIVRPSRELKGFIKVFVDPGKAVQVKFPVNAAMLEVYDRTDGKRKTEAGTYEIYIGASSVDIKLTGTIDIPGVKLEKSADKLADYLPSVSNIVDDGYRMNGSAGQFRSARPAGEDVSYAKLFADEFTDDEDEQYDYDEDGDEDTVDFLDESITVKTTAEGLIKCAASIGVGLDPVTAYELVAAMYASRVVMLRCDKDEFDLVHAAMCEYFGCPTAVDDTSTCADSDDILGEGDSALVGAVAHAASHRSSVTVAALDNVKPDSIGKIFTQFIRYSTAPDNIKVTYGAAKRSLDVTRNMWFLMRLYDGKCVFPAYVAEMSELVIPKVSAIAPTDVKAYAPDFHQFLAACRRAESRYELDEALWKKIDKLESFAAGKFPYKLGNKLCVQIERFAAVLLECGVDPFDVLDITVADKLVPHIASALDGKLTSDDGSLTDILDGIFGSDESARIKLSARRALGKEEA